MMLFLMLFQAEVLKDYYTDYSDPVHHCAREQTVNLLTNDFRRVSVWMLLSLPCIEKMLSGTGIWIFGGNFDFAKMQRSRD